MRFVRLSPEELQRAERICSPEFNPEPWQEWRTRLNRMAGGIDIYQEIAGIARDCPLDTLAENVMPSRLFQHPRVLLFF